MSELKRCPFCGAESVDIGISDYSDLEVKVCCNECGAEGEPYAFKQFDKQGYERSEEWAKESWNTRPTEDKLIDALENIKKHIETVFKTGYEFSATWNIANEALKKVKG